MYSSLVKQSALDVVIAEDRHVIAGTEESAARAVAARDKLRRILTEQIAYVIKTPSPARAAMVTEACAHFVRLGREYADRQAIKN